MNLSMLIFYRVRNFFTQKKNERKNVLIPILYFITSKILIGRHHCSNCELSTKMQGKKKQEWKNHNFIKTFFIQIIFACKVTMREKNRNRCGVKNQKCSSLLSHYGAVTITIHQDLISCDYYSLAFYQNLNRDDVAISEVDYEAYDYDEAKWQKLL